MSNDATFTTLVLRESDDAIHVRLNRPHVRNAIDSEMARELHAVCDLAEETPRVLTISGGDGIFAAGTDISQMRDRRRTEALRGVNPRLFIRIHQLPMPTIAVIDGPALGGGAELAYACDFRIGSPRARFGNPEIGLGVIAGAGACWRLIELVGEPVAKEILLAGRVLSAEECLGLRLLNRVVATEDLEAAAEELREKICDQGALAVQLTKRAIHAPRAAHPLVEELSQAILFETEEKERRMTAFLERRR